MITLGDLATLARADLELDQLYAGASHPLPYTLPLFDSRAVEAAAVQFVATRLEGYSNPPTPALSPAKQPAKPTADVQPSMRSSAHHEAELAAMTSELARLRERNASLKQQQEMMNVQLKSEQRAHSSCSSSVSSTPFRAKAALISEDDLRRRGEERLASAERTSAAAKGAAADWRMASVETLDRTLALLRKGRARDGGAGDLAVTLEKSRTGLALLAAGAVQEAHEAQDQERRSGIKEAWGGGGGAGGGVPIVAA